MKQLLVDFDNVGRQYEFLGLRITMQLFAVGADVAQSRRLASRLRRQDLLIAVL